MFRAVFFAAFLLAGVFAFRLKDLPEWREEDEGRREMPQERGFIPEYEEEVDEEDEGRREMPLERESFPEYEDQREEDEGRPEMLLERGLVPEYDDDPEVYRDTAWLLDRILMDGAEVVAIPPIVKYRYGSGNKQECVDGKKSIPPNCQWTGMVVFNETGGPVELKLTVAKKYCNEVGLEKPDNEIIDCEE
ncbi:hypothetical protein ABFA07_019444 [Porites harrisoni]